MKLKNYLIILLFVLTNMAWAQNKKAVSGVVLDADGLPLIGASILIQGTDQGAGADENGAFSLSVSEGQVLEVSYVFYKTKHVKIGKQNSYKIVLESDDQVLDDVVVIAYGTTSKEAVTGAVAMVGSEEIAKRSATNALGALEGAASGVRVNNTSGQPGAEPEIRIRGFSSFSTKSGSNSPLIVVDGVPFSGNLSDINPNDIDSMSVLKDASSSTLYGNRASNGVVLVTTKKASKGTGSFNFNMKQGVYTRGMEEYDRLGPDEFMETMWTGYRNSLIDPKKGVSREQASALASEKLISDILGLNIYNVPDTALFDANGNLVPEASILAGYKNDLDWYKPIERTGLYQDLNMNGRVANDKGGAYFSGSFLNNESYFNSSDYKRFTGRVNADYQVNDWLKVGANISGAHSEKNGISADPVDNNGSYGNPFMYGRNIAPIYPVHLHDKLTGDYVYDLMGNKVYDEGGDTRKQYVGRHVIQENELNQQYTVRNNLSGQFFGEFKLYEGLTFKVLGDLNVRNSEERKYDNAVIGDGKGNIGRSRREIYRFKTYTGQQILNYEKSFGEHHMEVLAGHENYSQERSYLSGRKTNETFPGMIQWANFSEMSALSDYDDTYRTEGYFTRGKYNYANKYFVEGSFRRDGSSKFHPDNRWGNFWSVGGSYVISNENFFNVKFVDYLKVRASYGEVGNDRSVDDYAAKPLYSITLNGGRPALYKNQVENKDLKWETSSSTNFGVDARLFKRMNLTVEYFDKQSQNLLMDLQLPLSMGSLSPTSANTYITSNVGSISNRGIEVSFDVDIISNKNWKWNVGANATWLKNKILTLPEENRENGIVSGPFKRVEGRSIYDFWLYKYAGVDQMTGDALYYLDTENNDIAEIPAENIIEINGNSYTNLTSYAKKGWSGNALPKMDGSVFTSLKHQGFTFSALLTYGIGGKILDYSYKSLMTASSSPGALHKDILNSWNGAPEGMTESSANRLDSNGTPRVDFGTSTEANATSDRFLQDASYLAIKSLTLNYDFDKDLLKSLKLRSLSMNLSVENLYTFTKLKGMNPQQAWNGIHYNGYVVPRTVIFGINVGF
ncbi:SusC/RagA family TonB-linked outer membrane protein [Myroides sp. LoEW2-1]|uniref:SusC/RagA family TonB-linked outer membrane protein n=1 Tax=Myroides sp. LoEW2-1 TaxID=2683192 RepID=UPI0013264B38|nr:SusC/RagA family TonB-linked outer membrane protein [Myroides sp. LoEW2-1]MVX37059.1 SusC/RagA family TonB-linked outer membrane protein [Myroides sp. LoEW2-1]